MKIDTRTTKSAVYLIDEEFPKTPKHPVPSGWDADTRGSEDPLVRKFGRGFTLDKSPDKKYPMTISRRFMPLRGGKASFHHIVNFNKDGDGFFLEFYDVEGNTALKLSQTGGFLCCEEKKLCEFDEQRTYSIGIEFDIDKKNAFVDVDGKACGSVTLLSSSLARLKTGYGPDDAGTCVVLNTILNINYAVCDMDYVRCDTDLPCKWSNLSEEGCSAGVKNYFEGQGFYTFKLDAPGGKTAKAMRKFSRTSGNVCFELKYLTHDKAGEKVTVSAYDGEKAVITFTDDGTKSMTSDGRTLREHNPYVWQTLRFEADTKTGKAFVKHNGKKCGFVDFDALCDGFDGISVSYSPKEEGYMRFADVFVFEIQPEPEDYPKPPVLPTRKSEYVTGMNICSLWRTGHHWGWDPISNFKDNITYLGFYDEGIPEVADWEIKWMLEHGLDCEFYCWYANQKTAPMFDTHLCAAQHDGHFNAKYGDMMKFAIIWEAMNCIHPESPEQFKKYYIPLWIDYYFSDPRYLQIDGYAIMALFGPKNLIKDLGSAAAVKECLDALREALKKIGYKGLAVLTADEPTQTLKDCGIDAVYAYNWGHYGYDPVYTKKRITNQIKNGGEYCHVVPTLSVGYNDVAWRTDRYPMMKLDDMDALLNWITGELLPSYSDKDAEWKKKLLMFSTWNEYGEGTYMCPAGLNGFGYLNGMRKAVTEEGDCFESDRPSQKVLDRLGYLHPKGRTLLYTPQLVEPTKPTKVIGEIKIESEEDVKKWRTDNVTAELKDGKMKGQATAFDPKFEIDVDIDADKVAGIEIMIRSSENIEDSFENIEPITSPWLIFFTTEENPEYRADLCLKRFASANENSAAVCDCTGVPSWKGKITKIRIDPADHGGNYEFEYLRFLASDETEKIRTYIDGRLYTSHHPSKIEDGECYVPFEAQRDFHVLTNLYYEWDNDERTLMTECDGNVSYWKENSDEVLFGNEKIKLKKPLEFFDGLPYMPLSVFCKINGYKYTEKDGRIDIITK